MSLRQFCTITASTKRATSLGSGRKGAPATHLSSLLVTPLWPLSAETIRTFDLNSPREMKECFHIPAAGDLLPDVVEGDLLTVAGTDYPIFSAAEWTPTPALPQSLHIVVQEVK